MVRVTKPFMILSIVLSVSSAQMGTMESGETCVEGDTSCFNAPQIAMFQKLLTAEKVLAHDESATRTRKSHAGRASELQTEMETLAEEVVKNRSAEISHVTRDALVAIKTAMDNLIADIEVGCKEDQAELDRAQNSLVNCSTYITSRLTGDGDLATMNRTQKELEKEHDDCRTTQVGRIGEKNANETSLRNAIRASEASSAHERCFSMFSNIPQDDKPPSPSGLSMETIAEMVDCIPLLAKWAAQAEASLVPKKAAFDAANDAYEASDGSGVKKTCRTKQRTYEDTFCQFAYGLAEGNISHAQCLANKGQNKQDAVAAVKVAEQAHKHQYIAAELVKCYADVILMRVSNKSEVDKQGEKLQQCKQRKHELTTDHVLFSNCTMNYPIDPVSSTCSTNYITKLPCNSEWNKTRYDNKDWHTTVQEDECGACPPLPQASKTTAATEAQIPNVAGLWFHLAASTLGQSSNDGDKVHTWPAADGSGKDVVAHDASEDVTFKAKGTFSQRPVAYFSGEHKLCTTDSYPVIQELTVFWKGTFEQSKKNDWSHLVGQGHDQFWVLRRYGGQSQVTMHTRNANSPNTNMEWDKPVIIVGTVKGGTRTAKVYAASDKRLISEIEKTDGNTIPAGQMPICIGVTEVYHKSGICKFRGEYEEVLVYNSVLSDSDKGRLIDYLQDPTPEPTSA